MATIKQTIAFKEVLNGSTISGAMKKAGYADSTTTTTGKLTNTDGWQELMNKHLPDRLLAKKHKEGLEATSNIVIDKIINDVADYSVRHKYLDSAYKLKGRYVDNELGGNKTLIINISGESSKRYGIAID